MKKIFNAYIAPLYKHTFYICFVFIARGVHNDQDHMFGKSDLRKWISLTLP